MELGGKSYWSTTFHTYGLYVGRDETIYYFDGIEVLRHPTNDISKEKPLFFLINYAIGGISGWPIDLERFGNASDMYVDYVRVFAENDIQYSIPLPEKIKITNPINHEKQTVILRNHFLVLGLTSCHTNDSVKFQFDSKKIVSGKKSR